LVSSVTDIACLVCSKPQRFFELIHTSMSISKWPLILAKFEIDFKAQLHTGSPVIIKTGIEKQALHQW
jgi:acyl-CoA thioesterase FadM